MTFHEAIEAAPPEVADLLGQLGVEDSLEDPDDVVRRLIEEAANRALAELRREAKSTAPSRSHGELSHLSGSLRLALEALRSVEPGPDYDGRIAEAERALLALLLGGPSMSPNPVA